MAYVSGAGDGGKEAGKADDMVDQEPEAPLQAGTSDTRSCIFCNRIRLPESHDRESLIVLRAQHNFVILNLYPYNTAHLMIVPYEHTADLPALDPETANEMMELAQKMVRVIEEEYKPDGFNLGMNLGRVAGAGVADHLHLHVVPRWAGDTNFMPIVGSTKVMPELPETTLDRLQRRLESIS
jgi:ATP adenylyltransferase